MPQIHSSINKGDKEWLERMSEEDNKDESVSYLVNRLILRARMEYEFTDKDPFRIEDRHDYEDGKKGNQLTSEQIRKLSNED